MGHCVIFAEHCVIHWGYQKARLTGLTIHLGRQKHQEQLQSNIRNSLNTRYMVSSAGIQNDLLPLGKDQVYLCDFAKQRPGSTLELGKRQNKTDRNYLWGYYKPIY